MSLPNTLIAKLVGAIVVALAIAILIHDRNRWKATASLRQHQVVAEKAAHLATVAGYRSAADAARKADAEHATRIAREQAQINERTADDFEKRIAAARARAGQLQPHAAGTAADPGAGRGTAVPGLSPAPGPIAEAPGQDRLSDALIATEQAIQLDELIAWVRRQAAVGKD